jgi:N-acetylglucosamine malate deacetylase 1
VCRGSGAMTARPAFLDGILEQTAARFLRRIYRITHRMPVKLRPIARQRVLVIAPHPDDEVIAIGGALALHGRAGSQVRTLWLTMDPPGPDGSFVRRGEAERAAKFLGFEPSFVGLPDGELALHEPAAAHAIAEAIRSHRPDAIFCPFPGDHHRDHQAASAATGAAIAEAGFKGEICCYEVWSNLWPNICLDISSVAEIKRQAIECYASVVSVHPYADAALGLNRFRGLKLGVAYAEALFVCDAHTFGEMCATLAVV